MSEKLQPSTQTIPVSIEKVILNKVARLGLFVQHEMSLISKIKTLPKCSYESAWGAWHLPFNQASLDAFLSLDIKYKTTQSVRTELNITSLRRVQSKQQQLPLPHHFSAVRKFKRYLEQRRYAPTTISQYEACIYNFLVWYGDKPILQIDIQAVNAYNHEAFIIKKKSRSAQNIWINALKLFLQKNENIALDVSAVERPRKESYIPQILSVEEIKKVISSYCNLKHKAIIFTIYACGMRRAEVLDLKLSDIDSNRGVIRIRQSKGAKDRDLPLPQNLLPLLRTYYTEYKPKTYLFEGAKGQKYSPSSLRKVLLNGVQKAGIKKKITVHSLRHSYATHLVEAQVNLRYIQEALGHKSSKTTEIYTKLSRHEISKMVSPIDNWEDI